MFLPTTTYLKMIMCVSIWNKTNWARNRLSLRFPKTALILSLIPMPSNPHIVQYDYHQPTSTPITPMLYSFTSHPSCLYPRPRQALVSTSANHNPPPLQSSNSFPRFKHSDQPRCFPDVVGQWHPPHPKPTTNPNTTNRHLSIHLLKRSCSHHMNSPMPKGFLLPISPPHSQSLFTPMMACTTLHAGCFYPHTPQSQSQNTPRSDPTPLWLFWSAIWNTPRPIILSRGFTTPSPPAPSPFASILSSPSRHT